MRFKTYLWELLTEYNIQPGIKSVLTHNLPISGSQNNSTRAGGKMEKENTISNSRDYSHKETIMCMRRCASTPTRQPFKKCYIMKMTNLS